MSDIAGIAGNAVAAYQNALSTVSNNIANVATDGYSRQDVVLSALPVTKSGSIFLGTGVVVDSVKRQYDAFVESNLRNTSSDLASQAPMVNYANRVVDVLGGPTMGLNTALDQFFSSARALSADTSSSVLRSSFVRDAEGVAQRFGQLSEQLGLIKNETQSSVDNIVEQMNTLTKQLAVVNGQLTKQMTEARQPPDLLDQRDLLLKQLAVFAHVNTAFSVNGQVTVSLGPSITQDIVVSGTTALPIGSSTGSGSSDKTSLVLDPYGKSTSLNGITSGTLAGLMAFQEQVLSSSQSALDNLAQTFAKECNTVHQQGIDAYGKPGQALFSFDKTASSLSSGMQVAFTDPMLVAAAAQFRVTEQANNTSGTDATLVYSPDAVASGPASLAQALVNNDHPSAARTVTVGRSLPVAAVATIPNGMRNVSIFLDTMQAGQQLQVLTRDGRQLIGQSMAGNSDLRDALMTSDNGFTVGASYSDTYLNGANQLSVKLSGAGTGMQSFLNVSIAGSAVGNTPSKTAALILASKSAILAGGAAIKAGITDLRADPNDATQIIVVRAPDADRPYVLAATSSAGIQFAAGVDQAQYKEMSVFYGAQADVQLQPVYNSKDHVSGSKPFPAVLQGERIQSLGSGIAENTLTVNGLSLPALAAPADAAGVAQWINANTSREETTVTFGSGLASGQSVTLAGLTYTATSTVTASELATAFSFLASGVQTGTGTAKGSYSGTWTGLNTGAATTASISATSTTAANIDLSTLNSSVSSASNAVKVGVIATASNEIRPDAKGIKLGMPLVINGVTISDAPAATSQLALANAINAAQASSGGFFTAKITPQGELIITNSSGHEGEDISISATTASASSAVNALGISSNTYRGQISLTQALSFADSPTNTVAVNKPIQLGFGSAGTPADLAKLGFRTGAYISGATKDDLLVFVTGSGSASVSATYAGKPVDAKEALRAQPMTVKFLSATEYQITDTKTNTVLAQRTLDPNQLKPGISYQGLQLSFTAAPKSGDQFTLDGNADGIGSNDTMLAMNALETKSVVGKKTLSNAYIDHVNEMGNIARQASISQTALTVVHDQAVKSRDEVSGVSLDKEAGDLIRYQQAYQAAAKTLQVASQLFDSVLQIR